MSLKEVYKGWKWEGRGRPEGLQAFELAKNIWGHWRWRKEQTYPQCKDQYGLRTSKYGSRGYPIDGSFKP